MSAPVKGRCAEDFLESGVTLPVPVTMAREVLRVVADDNGYAVVLPDDGEWARSDDPRVLENYVSLILHEEHRDRGRDHPFPHLRLPRQQVQVAPVEQEGGEGS